MLRGQQKERVGMEGRCGVHDLPDDPVVVSDCKLGARI